MEHVLLAVDDSKGSETAVKIFIDVFSPKHPERVLLLYVQKIEGRSLMDEMLGDAEMSTLKEMLKETDYQTQMDKHAQKVLSLYSEALALRGFKGLTPLIREGHPADEILSVAKQEGVDMIVLGSRGRRLHTLLMGSVSREVSNRADVPVLLAK